MNNSNNSSPDIAELTLMMSEQLDKIDQLKQENKQLREQISHTNSDNSTLLKELQIKSDKIVALTEELKQIEETTGTTQTAANEALMSELKLQNNSLKNNLEAIRSQYQELQESARITRGEADKVQKEFKGLRRKISRYRTVCLVCVAGMLFIALSYILKDVTAHDIICFLSGILG